MFRVHLLDLNGDQLLDEDRQPLVLRCQNLGISVKHGLSAGRDPELKFLADDESNTEVEIDLLAISNIILAEGAAGYNKGTTLAKVS